jgi:hypothetical protein
MPTSHAHSRNGAGLHGPKSVTTHPSEPDLGLAGLDDLDEELKRLSAANAELLSRLRVPAIAEEAETDEADEPSVLLRENTELRARIEELEQALVAAGGDDRWAERQREYEALLEEKSEVIRSLHLKLQEAQEGGRRLPNEPVPREEEIFRLKEELDAHRQQLQDDEESLMAQMRQMELSLSRDRAELARQRQELQRLQADVNREIELASRDPGLRERLMSLRRPQDPARKETPSAPPSAPGAAKGTARNSGIFRRLFGQG